MDKSKKQQKQKLKISDVVKLLKHNNVVVLTNFYTTADSSLYLKKHCNIPYQVVEIIDIISGKKASNTTTVLNRSDDIVNIMPVELYLDMKRVQGLRCSSDELTASHIYTWYKKGEVPRSRFFSKLILNGGFKIKELIDRIELDRSKIIALIDYAPDGFPCLLSEIKTALVVIDR